MKIAIFSLIIAVSVAALSVFQFNRYQKFTLHAQKNLQKLEEEINLKLTDTNKNIALLKEQEYAILNRVQDLSSTNLQTNLKKLENDINLKIDGFNKDINLLKEQDQAVLMRIQNPNWKLAEIEYLLYLAAARLEEIPNVKAAMDLLVTAQNKIKALNDPNLIPLSEAITKDLEALQAIGSPNIQALWLKIASLITDTTKLPFQEVVLNKDKKAITTTETPTRLTGSWKQAFLNSIKEVKELIKIRHYTKPIEPLLSPPEQTVLTANLRLLLEQMRLAMLTREPLIYQNALKNTEQLLSYYDKTDQNVQNFQNALTELHNITLNPPIPNLISLNFFKTPRKE